MVTRSTMPVARMSLSSQSYTWYLTEEDPQLRVRMTMEFSLGRREILVSLAPERILGNRTEPCRLISLVPGRSLMDAKMPSISPSASSEEASAARPTMASTPSSETTKRTRASAFSPSPFVAVPL